MAVIPKEEFADLRPPEERQPKPVVADVNVDKDYDNDDDDKSELPKRIPDRDFSDLD